MSIPFTVSSNAINIYLYGYPTTIEKSHPNYEKIFEILKNGGVNTEEEFRNMECLINIATAVKEAVKGTKFGSITVGTDCILHNDRPINNYLTQSMLNFIKQGLDVTPWALFMDKLYQNPSKTAVDELFLWLDKAGMPLTNSGNFLAYKKVKDDYSSFHRAPGGQIVMNTPGTIVEMPRNEVDDNRTQTCSTGLHFCSWHYLPSYYGSQGKVVLVEIDPRDVVSIPSDYDNAKGRAFRYAVVGEIDQQAAQFAFANTTVVDDDNDAVFFTFQDLVDSL